MCANRCCYFPAPSSLRTPIDLWRDTDQRDQWVSNNYGEVISENAAEFCLESSTSVSTEYKSTTVAEGLEHYPELLTNNVIDWYCDQDQLRADNFDIDGKDRYLHWMSHLRLTFLSTCSSSHLLLKLLPALTFLLFSLR